MKTKILTNLGFENNFCPYTKKNMWSIYLKISLGNAIKISYDLTDERCSVNSSEFSMINRKCKTEKEIIKFIDCIKFLYNDV